MNNLAIIKAYQDALWDDKNSDAIDQYFAENALIHSPVESVQGTAKMKTIIEKWYSGFPNLKVHWDDFICDENKVVSRWHCDGMHEGEFLGYPTSHKPINYSGVTIYELDQGKIVQYWAFVDMHGLLQQLRL